MEERSLQQRYSSGAWEVAEARAEQRGRPLPRRSAGAEVPALAGQIGLPGRVERLIRIERETSRIEQRLRGIYAELLQQHEADGDAFATAWERRLERISFLEVNELVEQHNEWFPIEAKLRWDRELDDYRAPFGLPWRKRPLDVAWALERFPGDPDAARILLDAQ